MTPDEIGDSWSDHTTDQFRIRHDRESDGPIAIAVAQGVAAVTGEEPTDIQPVYEVVDPDALDEIVAAIREERHGEVQFVLDDCEVTIKASGVIELQPFERGSI